MYGRYGMDSLSKFLTYLALILIIVSAFLRPYTKIVFFVLSVLCLFLTYFRCFSKDVPKRRAENVKYLAFRRRITDWFMLRRDMWKQRKDYKFFKCPSCKALLRVPKGKGRIRVVCKKCGTAFERKT